MRSYFFFRYLLLVAVAIVAVLGYMIYTNIFYLNGQHFDIKNISLESYGNLPKLVESWSGTKKLIPIENYKYLKGNNKITGIDRLNNRMAISLNFSEPDKEDNAEKRSADIGFTFPNFLSMTDMILFTTVEPEGKIIG